MLSRRTVIEDPRMKDVNEVSQALLESPLERSGMAPEQKHQWYGSRSIVVDFGASITDMQHVTGDRGR